MTKDHIIKLLRAEHGEQALAANPRVWYKKFQPQFRPMIESGRKQRTMRPLSKNERPQAGDIIACESWSGKPYASTVERWGAAILTVPEIVRIHPGKEALCYLQQFSADVGVAKKEAIAKLDGFETAAAMFAWFRGQYGPKPMDLRIWIWEKFTKLQG